MESQDVEPCTLALRSLAKVSQHDQALLKLLTAKLKGDDALMRAVAARAIGDFGRDGTPAVPELIEALEGKGIDNPEHAQRVRLAVIEAFQFIGPHSKDALRALQELATGQDAELRSAADSALFQILGRRWPQELRKRLEN
jgi:HEAT repeat protein